VNQAQAILIWAFAFLAFERSRPAHLAEVPAVHPAEVLSGGLITVADFLGYLNWKNLS
jgi:hypothetical protein